VRESQQATRKKTTGIDVGVFLLLTGIICGSIGSSS